jgi:hypothetical protein
MLCRILSLKNAYGVLAVTCRNLGSESSVFGSLLLEQSSLGPPSTLNVTQSNGLQVWWRMDFQKLYTLLPYPPSDMPSLHTI